MDYWQFIKEWRPGMVRVLAKYCLCPSNLYHLPLEYDEESRKVVLKDTAESAPSSEAEGLMPERSEVSLFSDIYGIRMPRGLEVKHDRFRTKKGKQNCAKIHQAVKYLEEGTVHHPPSLINVS